MGAAGDGGKRQEKRIPRSKKKELGMTIYITAESVGVDPVCDQRPVISDQ